MKQIVYTGKEFFIHSCQRAVDLMATSVLFFFIMSLITHSSLKEKLLPIIFSKKNIENVLCLFKHNMQIGSYISQFRHSP